MNVCAYVHTHVYRYVCIHIFNLEGLVEMLASQLEREQQTATVDVSVFLEAMPTLADTDSLFLAR